MQAPESSLPGVKTCSQTMASDQVTCTQNVNESEVAEVRHSSISLLMSCDQSAWNTSYVTIGLVLLPIMYTFDRGKLLLLFKSAFNTISN